MNTPTDELIEPFWSHVEALRGVLVRSLLIVAAGFILTFWFYQDIFALITRPLQSVQAATTLPLQTQEIKLERIHNTGSETVKYAPPRNTRVTSRTTGASEGADGVFLIAPGASLAIETVKPLEKLVIFGPVEGMVTSFKVCFWVSLVITAPVWLYFLLRFIVPALKSDERRLLGPFLCLSVAFLTGGLLFAYLVTLPLSNAFLWAFNAELGNNLWSLANYLDYTLFLLLANAFAFEISLVLFFLVHLGIITADWMTAHRRHTIVAALIIAALLTPPDVPSQLMLAVPLITLYEIAILYARFLAKKRQLSPASS